MYARTRFSGELFSAQGSWPAAYEKIVNQIGMPECGRLPPGHQPLSPPSQSSDAYHGAMLRFVALWCIAVGRPAFGSVGKAPAPCGTRLSRSLRDYESASAWTTLSFMDQNLCHRVMPRPKLGRSRPTTAATAPATFRWVHLQVVGRKQMAIAADTGYGHGLEDALQGKPQHISFGCSKARPATTCNGLHRRAPDCIDALRHDVH
jgi:hypothetical protein